MLGRNEKTRLHCPAAFQKRITEPICCHYIVHAQRKLPLDFFEWFEETFDQDFMITCPGTDPTHPRSGMIQKAELYRLPSKDYYLCLFFGFKISLELGEEILRIATEGDAPVIEEDSDKWGVCGCIFTFLQRVRPDILELFENEIINYFQKSILSQPKIPQL
ncbi:MAG: hypothetical protein ACFFCQ_00035 [Promethearchaeota archaeon]